MFGDRGISRKHVGHRDLTRRGRRRGAAGPIGIRPAETGLDGRPVEMAAGRPGLELDSLAGERSETIEGASDS